MMRILVDFNLIIDPTVANFSGQQEARDNRLQFPLAFETVFDSYYVDDILKSFFSPENAFTVALQVKQILENCGFNLTKFITNDVETFNRLSKNVSFDISNFNEMSEISVWGYNGTPKQIH